MDGRRLTIGFTDGTKLRSSSGHGVDWRAGWTSSTPGHLHTVPSFCRAHAHGDVTLGDPECSFVSGTFVYYEETKRDLKRILIWVSV